MNLLPKEIIPTVLCYTFCSAHEENIAESQGAPDITICNVNGYLLEFSNKKIINSCYILIEDAISLQLYCHIDKNKCMVYYFVRNENGVMVVVKKLNNFLVVVGCYNEVRDCKIFDFENRGYPQLGVYHFDRNSVQIINFSEFENVVSKLSNECADIKMVSCRELKYKEKNQSDIVNKILSESDEEHIPTEHNSLVFKSFLKKLQEIDSFNNTLYHETSQLQMLIESGIENYAMDLKPIKIIFEHIWSRINLFHWIIGVEFWSSGIKDVKEIQILFTGSDFESYTYKFFPLDGEEEREKKNWKKQDNEKGNGCVMDAKWGKFIAVCAFRIPEALSQKQHIITSLTFKIEGYSFKTASIHLLRDHFFQEKYQIFQLSNEISIPDLTSCLLLREEILLNVEMRHNLGITPEYVFVSKLGFVKAELLGKLYFIMRNGDLAGTSIAVEKGENYPVPWVFRIYFMNEMVLSILIHQINSILPRPSKMFLQ